MEFVATNPFKCRLWRMHDRLGEDVNAESCVTLIESIRRHGQKQPVLGRRLRGDPEHEIELIYGARRLFVAKHLGIDLTVRLRDMEDTAALIEMDIENRVRVDIAPYERGLSYRRWLREGFFQNQVQIAKALGVSEAQISRLLRYSELPAVVVNAFRSASEIREEWAVTLAKLCKDANTRDVIIRKARSMNERGGPRQPPQRVYDLLTAEGSSKIVSPRPRDEVIKSPDGSTVLRVGVRSKTVHLILFRHLLTQAALTKIVSTLTDTLTEIGRSL